MTASNYRPGPGETLIAVNEWTPIHQSNGPRDFRESALTELKEPLRAGVPTAAREVASPHRMTDPHLGLAYKTINPEGYRAAVARAGLTPTEQRAWEASQLGRQVETREAIPAGLTPTAQRATENFNRAARQVEATMQQRQPAPTPITEAEADQALDAALDSLWGTAPPTARTFNQPIQEARTPVVAGDDADQALDAALTSLWGAPAGRGR